MPYASVTRATLRSRLTERVGGNSVFWTDTEKNDAINEAISVWQALTGEWTGSATLPAVSGQVYYSVPDSIVSPQRLLYNSVPLTLSSLHELDEGFPGWENAASATPLYWAPLGFNRFALYPKPNGTLTITVEGIKEAPWLTTDGAFIDLGDEEVGYILDYAHHFLTFKEGGVELQSTVEGMVDFIEAAARKNAKIENTALYRRWMGLNREQTQRMETAAESTVGARG